ncbi:MAG: serpin family protein [Oscillospiraceae bacterium]|nr:serpin family protein [Oscillospiraceae bacterium]
MSKEIFDEALAQISDKHITEAANTKKRRPVWLGAAAAALALVILVTALVSPSAGASGLIAEPELPKMAPYPSSLLGWDYNEKEYEAWQNSQDAQYDQPAGYADSLQSYFTESIPVLLAANGTENTVCSPVNVYMALAMLAECTDGSSRQQILDLLNAGSINKLRTQAGYVWNAHYCDDSASTSLLANSLWLQDGYSYNTETVNTLASHYYASVYQGTLGSDKMNKALQSWLNDNTGGLLKEQASRMELPAQTVLALASTVYYRAKWVDTFVEGNTKQDVFHSPDGAVTCDFMNRTLTYGPYYYGEDFGAVRLGLEDGGAMWLVLPDEGCTPADLLESGHAITAVLQSRQAQSASVKVHLSLPKFDVAASRELSEGLKALGVTDVFESADFSPITDYPDIWLDRVDHAARVKIDEEGVEAAAYTVMAACGAPMPPEEEIYFTLDRPFLFVITSRDELPLFAGIVNNP